MLELHDNTGALIFSNDNWRETQEAAIEATGLQPNDDREAAIVATLDPGAYTAILQGTNNTTGTALVEAYDLDATPESQFANISTRGLVGTDDAALIGGLIISSEASAQANIVVRALGPSLGAIGVSGRAAGSDARIAQQQWRPGGVERQLARHAGRDHHLNRPRNPATTARRRFSRRSPPGPTPPWFTEKTRRPASDWSKRTIFLSTIAVRGANLTLRPGHPMQRGEQSKRS